MKTSKLILVVALGFFVNACSAQSDHKAAGDDQSKIHWMSLEEAQEAQKKEPRKLMVDVYTSWCGPCKMMMSKTFTHPKIIEYVNANYYAVKFNAEGPEVINFKGQRFENPSYVEGKSGRNGTHQLTGAIAAVNGSIAYPTIVYFDEELNIIQAVQGYLQPPQIEPILKYFGTNSHKTVPWPDYQKGFKSDI